MSNRSLERYMEDLLKRRSSGSSTQGNLVIVDDNPRTPFDPTSPLVQSIRTSLRSLESTEGDVTSSPFPPKAVVSLEGIPTIDNCCTVKQNYAALGSPSTRWKSLTRSGPLPSVNGIAPPKRRVSRELSDSHDRGVGEALVGSGREHMDSDDTMRQISIALDIVSRKV